MAKDKTKKLKRKLKKIAKQKAKRERYQKKDRVKGKKNRDRIINKVNSALDLIQEGRLEEATVILDKIHETDPDNPDLQFGWGVRETYLENYEDAIEHFDNAIESSPLYIEAHFNRAIACQRLVDIKGIIQSLRKVVELRQIDPELGDLAEKQLDELAESIGKDGLTLDQFVEAQTHFEIGFEYMEQEDFAEAIPYLKKAISINPKPPQPYGNLGLCYAYLGDKEQALAYLDKALEIEPSYKPAADNREVIKQLKPGETLLPGRMETVHYNVSKGGF